MTNLQAKLEATNIKELQFIGRTLKIKKFTRLAKKDLIQAILEVALEVTLVEEAPVVELEVVTEEVTTEDLSEEVIEIAEEDEILEADLVAPVVNINSFLPKLPKELIKKANAITNQYIAKAKIEEGKKELKEAKASAKRDRSVARKVVFENNTHINNTTVRIPKKWQPLVAMMDKDEKGYFVTTAKGYIFSTENTDKVYVEKRNDLWEMVKTIVAI